VIPTSAFNGGTHQLTHLPVAGTRRSPTIDFSSLSLLADCQWWWHYRYVRGGPDKPTTAMLLGTLLGECASTWWEGGHWQEPIMIAMAQWQRENPEAEFTPEYFERAAWLMERYEAHYGPERASVKVIGTEVPFRLRLPNRYGWLVGRIDQLFEIDGRLWVVERKTMGDFSRAEKHTRSHQTTLYFWAAQCLGYQPWGILLDCLRTYRWKRDEHPPEDSFQRRWFDRNDTHLDNAVLEAGKALTLAKLLIGGQIQPLRNINDHCDWCPYVNECTAELGFNDLVVPDAYIMEE
jgi:PD-(D/E)XK nuclease superfamily protein